MNYIRGIQKVDTLHIQINIDNALQTIRSTPHRQWNRTLTNSVERHHSFLRPKTRYKLSNRIDLKSHAEHSQHTLNPNHRRTDDVSFDIIKTEDEQKEMTRSKMETPLGHRVGIAITFKMDGVLSSNVFAEIAAPRSFRHQHLTEKRGRCHYI